MLVRDAGENWQIVMQPDHADLSGQLAAAWGGEGFARPTPLPSVVRAATRHDDGWAVWERRPRLHPETGAPLSFFEVPVPVHLAFYQAGVEAAAEEDPYAGLLVSMHMSGLYRGRYDTMPSLRPMSLSGELRAAADVVCDAEEARQARLVASLGVPEDERWTNYRLLQVFDLVSLYFGLNDLAAGAEGGTDGVPTAAGPTTRIAIEPLGPRRVRLDPYPFVESPARFTMARRLVPKRSWPDDDAFRRDLFAAPLETIEIVAER